MKWFIEKHDALVALAAPALRESHPEVAALAASRGSRGTRGSGPARRRRTRCRRARRARRPGSVDAVVGMSKVPPGLRPFVACIDSSEQALSARSVVAAPQTDKRNERRDTPSNRALRSQSSRARRIVSSTTGERGTGSYSPFEHGPNLIGRPGSSSRQRRTGHTVVTVTRRARSTPGARRAGCGTRLRRSRRGRDAGRAGSRRRGSRRPPAWWRPPPPLKWRTASTIPVITSATITQQDEDAEPVPARMVAEPATVEVPALGAAADRERDAEEEHAADGDEHPRGDVDAAAGGCAADVRHGVGSESRVTLRAQRYLRHATKGLSVLVPENAATMIDG